MGDIEYTPRYLVPGWGFFATFILLSWDVLIYDIHVLKVTYDLDPSFGLFFVGFGLFGGFAAGYVFYELWMAFFFWRGGYDKFSFCHGCKKDNVRFMEGIKTHYKKFREDLYKSGTINNEEKKRLKESPYTVAFSYFMYRDFNESQIGWIHRRWTIVHTNCALILAITIGIIISLVYIQFLHAPIEGIELFDSYRTTSILILVLIFIPLRYKARISLRAIEDTESIWYSTIDSDKIFQVENKSE